MVLVSQRFCLLASVAAVASAHDAVVGALGRRDVNPREDATGTYYRTGRPVREPSGPRGSLAREGPGTREGRQPRQRIRAVAELWGRQSA